MTNMTDIMNITKEINLVKKFNINTKSLEEEQHKLAKLVIEKDAMDFTQAQSFGGMDVTTTGRELIGSITTISKDFEILEQKFSTKRAAFPYIPGFLAFRELPVLLDAYKKLETKPDIIFISRHGVLHPRQCGMASHFGIATNSATIGIAKDLLIGDIKGDKVYLNGKLKGQLVETKKGGKPIIVSVGHKISLKTAVSLTKKFTREPHKFPEPIAMAHKFANKVKDTLGR